MASSFRDASQNCLKKENSKPILDITGAEGRGEWI